ncbi:MAG: two-component system response regulator LytT [Alteromonadaceae bacterium]|jgi:two-component system response regulator LytT
MLIIIVEDEPLIQQRIKRLTEEILAVHQPKVVCFDDIDNAESFISENVIDLLLLDLNLMGRDGFTLLQNNLADAYHTIIISAYADKAIEAFEYGVLDFVAKPFTTERLARAFDRFVHQDKRINNSCKYLSIKRMGAIELIPVADIEYIQADGHYTLLHLKNTEPPVKQTLLHHKNIEKIQQLLANNFFRVHRSYVVNMNKVLSLKIAEGSKYALLLTSGETVPVGRTKYEQVKQLLNKQ